MERLPGQPLGTDRELTAALSQQEPSSFAASTTTTDAAGDPLAERSSSSPAARTGDEEGGEAPLDGSYFPRYRFSRFQGWQYLCFLLYIPFGAKNASLSSLCIKTITSPRQARRKHRES
jgi:hypothetical protein